MEKINVIRADDPKEIIWENMALTNCWRIGRRILTVIVAIAFIIFNFFTCFYLNTLKSNTSGRIQKQI